MSEAYPAARRYDRLPITLEVNYKTEMEFLNSTANNISAGGMFIRTMYPLPEGTELNIQFSIPEVSIYFSVTGKIVWAASIDETNDAKESGMGIKFINMAAEKSSTLEKYIAGKLAGG